jgi:hypothetical protein
MRKKCERDVAGVRILYAVGLRATTKFPEYKIRGKDDPDKKEG